MSEGHCPTCGRAVVWVPREGAALCPNCDPRATLVIRPEPRRNRALFALLALPVVVGAVAAALVFWPASTEEAPAVPDPVAEVAPSEAPRTPPQDVQLAAEQFAVGLAQACGDDPATCSSVVQFRAQNFTDVTGCSLSVARGSYSSRKFAAVAKASYLEEYDGTVDAVAVATRSLAEPYEATNEEGETVVVTLMAVGVRMDCP